MVLGEAFDERGDAFTHRIVGAGETAMSDSIKYYVANAALWTLRGILLAAGCFIAWGTYKAALLIFATPASDTLRSAGLFVTIMSVVIGLGCLGNWAEKHKTRTPSRTVKEGE